MFLFEYIFFLFQQVRIYPTSKITKAFIMCIIYLCQLFFPIITSSACGMLFILSLATIHHTPRTREMIVYNNTVSDQFATQSNIIFYYETLLYNFLSVTFIHLIGHILSFHLKMVQCSVRNPNLIRKSQIVATNLSGIILGW